MIEWFGSVIELLMLVLLEKGMSCMCRLVCCSLGLSVRNWWCSVVSLL